MRACLGGSGAITIRVSGRLGQQALERCLNQRGRGFHVLANGCAGEDLVAGINAELELFGGINLCERTACADPPD